MKVVFNPGPEDLPGYVAHSGGAADGPAEESSMNPVLRVGLRALGSLMLIGGLAFLGLLVAQGPTQIAEWAGNSCAHGSGALREAEACTWQDVMGFVPMAGIMVLVGGVLALVMRKGF